MADTFRMLLAVNLLIAVLCCPGFSTSLAPAAGRRAIAERAQLTELENEWLHATDVATLNRILADDFLHPVPGGLLLTKQQHIAWFTKHPSPSGVTKRFDQLRVRLYGNVAIVNGIFSSKSKTGIRRTIFTDVFVRRNQRWQAVNAQENPAD